MAGKDYYNILGVSRTATELEIKQAYRRLARRHHPDVNPGDKSAEDRFKQINEAYEVLSNAEKRKKYDRFGDGWEYGDQYAGPGAGPTGRPPGGPTGQPQYGAPQWDFSNFERAGGGAQGTEGLDSILDELLHGVRGGARRKSPRARQGADIESPVEITLEEAFHGTMRNITLQGDEPCPTCHGSGRVGTAACGTCRGAGVVRRMRRLEVKIPAGVTTGSRVRVAGQGQPGYGGQNGDLYLLITVRPHQMFERQGDDLLVDVGIPLSVAMLGGEIQVPTLSGKLALRIPPETQNGRVFRLAGQGMPHLGTAARGDMLARINVILPTKLSAEEKELFRRLQDLRPAG